MSESETRDCDNSMWDRYGARLGRTRVEAAVCAALVACAALLVAGVGQAASVKLWAVDGSGQVSALAATSASLQRTPPASEPADPSLPHGDSDALRYLLSGMLKELPSLVQIDSIDEHGTAVGLLADVPLEAVPCPTAVTPAKVACAVTPPIRAVVDDTDTWHPLVRRRSIRAALGGALLLRVGLRELGRIRVTGPRRTPVGAIERHRAKLRFVFVRLAPQGDLPLGGDEAGAIRVAHAALARANALWGACGFSFGGADDLAVEIVEPPPPHLLSIGCGHGLPASGGQIRLVVDGSAVVTSIASGMRPAEAARRVARSLRRVGFEVHISDNASSAAGAGASTDLSVRNRHGALATIEPPASGGVSTDATLTACVGHVNLEDGLQHFGDVDAVVGTVEERTLVKAYDDFDPTTIDVFLVPGFAKGGRIGESFIGADRGAIRNVVIVDRAGIRSNRASFALAHEVGHVLLDDPGHPDDFHLDLPTRLMDADAADPTAFGPRRLSVEECAAALRQSGLGATLPLLTPWPLSKIKQP